MRNYKSEYFGSPSTLTSTANQELIQQHKSDITGATLVASIFDFIPSSDCTVIINGGNPILFKAGKEFAIDCGTNPMHIPIWQFQIVESSIQYWYMGIFKNY